jgi:hypothetical protein
MRIDLQAIGFQFTQALRQPRHQRVDALDTVGISPSNR